MERRPEIVNKTKSSSHPLKQGRFYTGTVTAVLVGGRINVKIPELGTQYGPLTPLNTTSTSRYIVGDSVKCGFADEFFNEVIVFGSTRIKEDVFAVSENGIDRFADYSARDYSIPVPSEGRVVYVLDSDELQIYNGTAWITVIDTGNSFGYKVGDTGPGGGIIFFVDRFNEYADFTYLEVATIGAEVQRTWAPSSPVNYQSTVVSGADSKALGTGYQNTIDIVAQGHTSTSTSAAKYCDARVAGGQSDWYLPSLSELRLIFELFRNKDIGGFTQTGGTYYWSSSESDATLAYVLGFQDGTEGGDLKSNSYYVRPMRRF